MAPNPRSTDIGEGFALSFDEIYIMTFDRVTVPNADSVERGLIVAT